MRSSAIFSLAPLQFAGFPRRQLSPCFLQRHHRNALQSNQIISNTTSRCMSLLSVGRESVFDAHIPPIGEIGKRRCRQNPVGIADRLIQIYAIRGIQFRRSGLPSLDWFILGFGDAHRPERGLKTIGKLKVEQSVWKAVRDGR